MSKNDSRVLALKKEVESKRKKIKQTKFTPETNCILILEDIKYNINVLPKDKLLMLLIRLNSYIISANDLGIKIPEISGYDIDLWIKDIQSKIRVLEIKEDERDLKEKETLLDKLLSEDKRTEMMLDEIEKSLR